MQSATTPIHISPAARLVQPGLMEALHAAGSGRASNDGPSGLEVVSGDDPPRGETWVRLSHAVEPCLTTHARQRATATHPAFDLAFDTPDLRFAAAILAQLARGETVPTAADPNSVALNRLARRVASSPVTVMINGPTGSGKEVLARHIHASSGRRNGPLVAVNCAALPEAMLEALLFGHERGAFTGAAGAAKGLFRAAEGGTLLLDEVTELPIGLQAKLLRALQEREVLPIGATMPQKIDVRIIAAANRDLVAEVSAGRFRADLYYRLAVFPLTTTALVTRPADIVPLAAALWLKFGGQAWPTPAALEALEGHSWPGNVRELANVLQRALVLSDGVRIHRRDIVFDTQPNAADPPLSLGCHVRAREFAVIRSTLADCAGRRGDTARRLGISERTLRYKMAAMSMLGLMPGSGSSGQGAATALTLQ